MLTTSSLSPELAELDRQFAAAKAEASELVDGLQESQFHWCPGAHSWSMAECLLHLNMVGDRCAPARNDSGGRARARPSGGRTLWVWLVGEVDYRPYRAAIQAQIQGSACIRPSIRPAHNGGTANFPAVAGPIVGATATSQRIGSGPYQGARAGSPAAQIQSPVCLHLDRRT